MIKVGVTGGIGSGKSTLCRLLWQYGAAVYDSDSEAKRLMSEDTALKAQIVELLGAAAYRGEQLDRGYISQIVFSDKALLAQLNGLVHPAVRRDFERWCEAQSGDYVVLESAILFESRMDSAVDVTVAVVAPEPLRIERTCTRDGVDAERVKSRISMQMSDDELHARADYTVVNILEEDLEAAAKQLDAKFRYEAHRDNA